MPKRTDIEHVMVIGSGPILIGQAAEFDYSGTQACRVLRAEGLRVSLVNSNPATIMTDPEVADATYIEPLTPEFVEKVIAKERPDALLATLGGQTALNIAIGLYENGVLEKYGVQLIGADVDAINRGEDRQIFKDIVRSIGADAPRSTVCAHASTRRWPPPRRSATRSSSGPASPWAASARASPPTSRCSAGWPATAWPTPRCTPSSSRSRCSAGRSTSSS